MNSKQSGTLTNLSNRSSKSRKKPDLIQADLKKAVLKQPAACAGILSNVISPERKKQLVTFAKASGIKFRNNGLLNLSFIHRSALNETGFYQSNERLEFLGDAILGAACASILFQKFPESPEGQLAKIKSVTVSEDVLSAVALELKIDTMLLLGKGEDLTGGRKKKAILADAMEAVIGALYLDSGYEAAFAFVCRYFTPEINRITEKNYHRDYKSLLQEICMQRYHEYPQYRLVKFSGPEHERLYWMEVKAGADIYGPGMGKNKKNAEQEAAKIAFLSLDSSDKNI